MGRSTIESGAAAVPTGINNYRELPDPLFKTTLDGNPPYNGIRRSQPVQAFGRDRRGPNRKLLHRVSAAGHGHHTVHLLHAVGEIDSPLVEVLPGDGKDRLVGPRIALHPDRFHRDQPALVQTLQFQRGGRAQAADGEPRTRKRMPVEELIRQAQLAANLADFVFVEKASGSTIRFSSISFCMPATRL